MRILLTGGAGYIGSACLRRLLKHGHHAIAFDNLSEGNAAAIPKQNLIRGDLDDAALLTKVLKEGRFDAVMHFAAMASVPDSINDPDTYYRVNVIGTKNLLDAMRAAGVKRLICSSTAATYSFAAPMPLNEQSPQQPEVPYGTTKLAAEWMIQDYARAYDLGYVTFRYFNAAGADLDGTHGESRKHESHLIPLVFAAATGKRPFVGVFGSDYDTPDGTCIRDYVHVEDIAQAHEAALDLVQPKQGHAFNLGSGRGSTVLEVIQATERVVGHAVPYKLLDRRPGDPGVLVASPERAKQVLGWKLEHSDLDTIVSTAWSWYSKYPDGYAGRAPVEKFESVKR